MTRQEALIAQDNLFMSGYKIDKDESTASRIVYISMRGEENQEIVTKDRGQTFYLNQEDVPTPQVPESVGNQLTLF